MKRGRHLWFGVFFTVVLCQLGADNISYNDYRILEQVELGAGPPLCLAPDGTVMLRFLDRKGVMVLSGPHYQQETLIGFDAGDLEFSYPDLRTIAWGPDCRQVAFVIAKPLVAMREPDILVLDLDDERLRNLTPDEGPNRMWESETIDLYPCWADNPDILYFVRGQTGDERGTYLCSLDLSSGRIQQLFVLSTQNPYHIYPLMRAFAGGRSFIFNRDYRDWAEGEMGLWRLDLDRDVYRNLIWPDLTAMRAPWLIDLGPRGQSFLFYYRYRSFEIPYAGFSLYDLTADTITPVHSGEDLPTGYAVNACLAPDGQGLLYVVRDQLPEEAPVYRLYIRDIDAAEATLLLETTAVMAVYNHLFHQDSRGLQWAEGDKVLLRIADTDYLLRLGP